MQRFFIRSLLRFAEQLGDVCDGLGDCPCIVSGHRQVAIRGCYRSHNRLAIAQADMQRLSGSDLLDGRPFHRNLAGEFRLDQQRLVVRLLDGSGQTIAILQPNLIGEQERRTQANENEREHFYFRQVFPPKKVDC